MNGAGNDFVAVDNRDGQVAMDAGAIRRVCDRHRGVGADGLLAVEPSSSGADFRMRYYNSDGGEAEMCGNGARCFARFARRLMGGNPETVRFETGAGIVTAKFSNDRVTIALGDPHGWIPPQELDSVGGPRRVHFLNTGVPHAVVFVADVETVDVAREGAALRHHPAFAPRGTNVNFATIEGPGALVVRTFERGVEGETLACGTGVTATALLHHIETGEASPITVRVRGGDMLVVDFLSVGDSGFQNVALTGPADFVFEGVISL